MGWELTHPRRLDHEHFEIPFLDIQRHVFGGDRCRHRDRPVTGHAGTGRIAARSTGQAGRMGGLPASTT